MITLTTDFGLKDPYVATLKGVIYTINPHAKIIDLTHNIEKFNLRSGAFVLAATVPYFPSGTIHVVVVDPGVGTARRALVVQTKQAFFVGPDNGILMLAAKRQGIEHVYELSNSRFWLTGVSNTFHGRDIFVPVAAYLDRGIAVTAVGSEITPPPMPNFGCVTNKAGVICGEVLYIDDFGNVITNISGEALPNCMLQVDLAGVSFQLSLTKTYAQTKPQGAVVLIGSHGFLELALNQGHFAKKYPVRIGDPIKITQTSV
jgi:S-adenosylmethionine hydrolase